MGGLDPDAPVEHDPEFDGPDAVALHVPAYRPLVRAAVRAVAESSGCHPSGMCTVVMTGEEGWDGAIHDEFVSGD